MGYDLLDEMNPFPPPSCFCSFCLLQPQRAKSGKCDDRRSCHKYDFPDKSTRKYLKNAEELWFKVRKEMFGREVIQQFMFNPSMQDMFRKLMTLDRFGGWLFASWLQVGQALDTFRGWSKLSEVSTKWPSSCWEITQISLIITSHLPSDFLSFLNFVFFFFSIVPLSTPIFHFTSLLSWIHSASVSYQKRTDLQEKMAK